jgi:hypothetical protein
MWQLEHCRVKRYKPFHWYPTNNLPLEPEMQEVHRPVPCQRPPTIVCGVAGLFERQQRQNWQWLDI